MPVFAISQSIFYSMFHYDWGVWVIIIKKWKGVRNMRMLAMDIDGTCLNNNHRISHKTLTGAGCVIGFKQKVLNTNDFCPTTCGI